MEALAMEQKKPKRRTRERILETALRLFNEFGEPNVTTTVIADEMNISPGNLYYHFHSKDEIVNDLFSDFEREIDRLLSVPSRRNTDVEDVWLYLHLLFESIWRYRFLYRDLVDLLTRNRLLEVHVGRILERRTLPCSFVKGWWKRRRCKPLRLKSMPWPTIWRRLEPAGCHFPMHEIHGGKWRARR